MVAFSFEFKDNSVNLPGGCPEMPFFPNSGYAQKIIPGGKIACGTPISTYSCGKRTC